MAALVAQCNDDSGPMRKATNKYLEGPKQNSAFWIKGPEQPLVGSWYLTHSKLISKYQTRPDPKIENDRVSCYKIIKGECSTPVLD